MTIETDKAEEKFAKQPHDTIDAKDAVKLGRLNLEMVRNFKGTQSEKNNQEISDEQLEAWAENLENLDHDNNSLFKDTMKIKTTYPKPTNFKFLKLTVSEIKDLSTDKLLVLLSGENHNYLINEATIQLISHELLNRKITEASKPHWTVYVVLVVTIIAAIASVLGLLK